MSKMFRTAVLEDAQNLHEMILDSYQRDLEVGVVFQASKSTLEEIQKHIETHICYVMEIDGTLAATCSLRLPWSKDPGPTNWPHIKWLCVSTTFARQGLGTEMLQFMEQEVVKKMLKSPGLTLGTAVEHPWLSKMYEKLGYQHYQTVDLGFGHLTAYFRKELDH